YWIENRGIIRCIGKAKMALWPRLLYLFNSILYSHNNKAFETKGNFHFKCFFVFFTVKNFFLHADHLSKNIAWYVISCEIVCVPYFVPNKRSPASPNPGIM